MNKKIQIFFILAAFLLPGLIQAQLYKVDESTDVKINGGSTMHDWESDVEEVTGSANITTEGNIIKEISSLSIQFVVKSIESGKGKMNSLTYEALKEKSNPKITFNLTKVNSINGSNLDVQGDLTIAGKTNSVNLKGKASVSGTTITITGEQGIDMTQYGVDPPTAMLGTIKVDPNVTIKYSLVLKK
ncbi:YceI family protein [Flexithrix dorotheae]|uniref:YceI family protein n=1 Tax=Flexithrix dorotheae TaxID=70993 RepID=UPI00037DEC34|nr:YceI family protein [Flexithrix dorotheae]